MRSCFPSAARSALRRAIGGGLRLQSTASLWCARDRRAHVLVETKRDEAGRRVRRCYGEPFSSSRRRFHAQSSQSDIDYDYSTKRWTVKTRLSRPDSQNWPGQIDLVLPGPPPYVVYFASPQGPPFWGAVEIYLDLAALAWTASQVRNPTACDLFDFRPRPARRYRVFARRSYPTASPRRVFFRRRGGAPQAPYR